MGKARRIACLTPLALPWILASFVPAAAAFHLRHKVPLSATLSMSSAEMSATGASASAPSTVHRYESPFFPTGGTDGDRRIPSALILLNTPMQSSGADTDGSLSGALGALWEASSYRVCADGGANRLYDATVAIQQGGEDGATTYLPDIITGDLDSVRPDVRQYYETRGVAVVRVADQNYHDLDKSLMAVEKWAKGSQEAPQPSRAFIYGAFGGRFDQEMGCINAICVWGKKEAFRRTTLALYNEETCAFALNELPMMNEIRVRYPGDSAEDDKQNVQVGEGPTCGLIPILGRCESVVTTGLKWNLDGEVPLEFGGLVSSSNRVLEDVVTVETSSPMMFTAEMIVKGP